MAALTADPMAGFSLATSARAVRVPARVARQAPLGTAAATTCAALLGPRFAPRARLADLIGLDCTDNIHTADLRGGLAVTVNTSKG